MLIKKLEKEELFDAYLIAVYCFHMRVEDTEAKRESIEAEQHDDWGAFDEDGTMMARIINHRFPLYLDGKEVATGGIGAVSTLPEYRDRGAIREIFKELLPYAYRDGEVLSTLFPFNHQFYRKVGYEVVTYRNEYCFPPAVLCNYQFDGKIQKWNPGDSVDDFLKVYQAFAIQYNCAMSRDTERMLMHLKVDKPYMDRRFSYVFKKNGENDRPIAYVIFKDIRHDPAAILQVEECAWTCRDGFHAILGFLARFESDYGEIKLPLPKGIDLLRMIESPHAYDIQVNTNFGFMVRVINAKRVLEEMRKPYECDFSVKITDEFIPENNGVFHVMNGENVEVAKYDKADIELSIQAFGQMAIGAVNFDEALLRKDVVVHAKEEMLRQVFVEKKIFVGESF